jgi:hypothetical protein
MLVPITIGAACMAVKGLSGHRNRDLPDLTWTPADPTINDVSPTSKTTIET